jgi:hypothetical protein
LSAVRLRFSDRRTGNREALKIEGCGATPTLSRRRCELAAEGCWNAIRHANAATVEVRLEPAGGRAVLLTVVNDGPASLAGEPGIGRRMFEEMTLAWDLQREADRTVLTAVVPVG